MVNPWCLAAGPPPEGALGGRTGAEATGKNQADV